MSITQSYTVQSKPSLDKSLHQQSKGERTREKILLAAINVLAIKGIKGTTHRAIANDAQIQLSLTTYYFKDINELLLQAFQLNSDQYRDKTNAIFQKFFAYLNNIDKSSLRKVSVKNELREILSEMIASFLFENIKKEAKSLAIEQLMFTSVQTSLELKKLAHEHEQSQLKPLTQLISFFNKKDPEVDAQIMRTVFSQLQYSLLGVEPNELSIEPINKVTRKLIGWIMGLKK